MVFLSHLLNRAIAHASKALHPTQLRGGVEMLKAGSSLLCGLFVLLTLYVLLTLSGCSVMMVMAGDQEPHFEHIKLAATTEALSFGFH